MNQLITEIPPLTERDSYYLQERHKPSFNYPLHKHAALELNFVENCAGARRIVGDHREVISDYDLALIGSNIEHMWEHHECSSGNIHEITIQMMPDLFPESVLQRRHMQPLQEMFENAKVGIAFGMKAIMKVYDRLNELTQRTPDFHSVSMMTDILYDLAMSHDYHRLASSSYSHADIPVTSRRVKKIKDYIDQNYSNDIRLETLADMVSMTPNALSRFFKQHTNRSITDYFIDVRLGHAAIMLTDSNMTVVEIAYSCGFNTISNFNRTFKRYKGLTPTAFRESYKKTCFTI